MKRIIITPSITRRDEEGLETYLDQIAKAKTVTPDEEAALALRIRQGDEKALAQLVSANLRFVVSVAKTYQNQGMSLSDLISEGNLGLVTAARRYDETRGFKFISYAVWWIRQAILEALNDQSRLIRLPHNQQQLLRMIRRYQECYQLEHGMAPTAEQIAEHLDVPEQRVIDLLQANGRNQSLDAPLTDEDGGTLVDVLADDDSERADAAMDHESLSIELQSVLHRLFKDRDIYVLLHSFGIGCSQRTHEEIGADLGLTRERVRQIRERALQKLRCNRMARERLMAFCQ